MGVRDLWTLLDPACEPVPLTQLGGRQVAVDLSGWLVESENSGWSAGPGHGTNFLRTLVFRLAALLRQLTLPVFVLDGAAPALKLDELHRRRGAGGGRGGGGCGRQRLRAGLGRCVPLLESLGVPHVRAPGEAEAVCAQLDASARVDGVLSDDGDALLYGAKTVYRRLTLAARGGDGGRLTRCCASTIREKLGLNVEQMRALAVLSGCDFMPDGLPGVGIRTAVEVVRRTLSACDGDDAGSVGERMLSRLRRQLRESTAANTGADEANSLTTSKRCCLQCGHAGSVRQHRSRGCGQCATSSGCGRSPGSSTESVAAERRCLDKLRQLDDVDAWFSRAQLTLREFAAGDMRTNTDVTTKTREEFQWRQPDVERFCQLTSTLLDWQRPQAEALILPLLARWRVGRCERSVDDQLRLEQVVRSSRREFVECFLVEWCWQKDTTFSTHEPKHLLQRAFPVDVQHFQQAKKAGVRKPTKRASNRTTSAIGKDPPIANSIAVPKITDYFSRDRSHSVEDDLSRAVSALSVNDPGGRNTASNAAVSGNVSRIHRASSSPRFSPSRNKDDSGSSELSDDDEDDSCCLNLSSIVNDIVAHHIGENSVVVVSDDSDIYNCTDTTDTYSSGVSNNDAANVSRPYFSLDITSWTPGGDTAKFVGQSHSRNDANSSGDSSDSDDAEELTLLERLKAKNNILIT